MTLAALHELTDSQPLDGLIYNVTLASFDPQVALDYGLIEGAALGWRAGEVCWIGKLDNAQVAALEGAQGRAVALEVTDGRGQLLTPGLVDCHTHLVYGGDRAQEFEWRLQGKSYQAIAAEGGGIKSTVKQTRAQSEQALFASAYARLLRLHQSGVTCIEIKSGYGLDLEAELKMLRVIRRLGRELPLTVRSTCLAAHALPPGYEGSSDDYIEWICTTLLPQVAAEGLADAVDIYCESIAFSSEQAARLFQCAQDLGLAIKGHVEQLSQCGGTDVVCEYQGLSVDHIEYINEAQVEKIAACGAVAVLLPGAFYYLHETQRPPIAALREHRVPMAVATDMNPGTSPVLSITQAANMACVLFGLTPAEALAGVTLHGACALGLNTDREPRYGCLRVGAVADMVLWPCKQPVALVYESPAVAPERIWLQGKPSTMQHSTANQA